MTPSTHRSKAGNGKRLGEYVRHLVVGSDFDESHVPILNRLMRKMLADVDVLGTLASADDMDSPFDARPATPCCPCRLGCHRLV